MLKFLYEIKIYIFAGNSNRIYFLNNYIIILLLSKSLNFATDSLSFIAYYIAI